VLADSMWVLGSCYVLVLTLVLFTFAAREGD